MVGGERGGGVACVCASECACVCVCVYVCVCLCVRVYVSPWCVAKFVHIGVLIYIVGEMGSEGKGGTVRACLSLCVCTRVRVCKTIIIINK